MLSETLLNEESDSIRLLQITDTHLFAPEDGALLGVPTRKSFQSVVEQVLQRTPDFDAILATGDISQDHTVESYQHFVKGIIPLKKPCFWLPGNHDYKPSMGGVLPSPQISACEHLLIGLHWQVIILDSQVVGVPHGALSDEQLTLLDNALSQHPQRHSLVLLHHHPLPAGSAWLDQHQLKESEQFWSVLAKHHNVNGIVCGHIHQELDRVVNGIRLLATPSTCVQFLPDSDDFALDSQAPGWRTLDLLPNGDIETQVYRLKDCDFSADSEAGGY
ncbi:3',5'-cyclic-AMP phosphodiesterase [Aliivibrio fischeri]|uniref:3',5'-cyclic-AMP phosphodiesterase n=1 Tax=Aliivibrio fischeri TaxID=668 RepID=UPI0007C43C33|nr:3',5'-cyclic-AMP phosphodiesterase [Aliivibrio fischeri]